MSKVYIIFGTRPEAIKLFPVYKEFTTRNISVKLINTGQHKELLDPILQMADIVPDINLNVMQKDQSLTELSIRLMQKFNEIFSSELPNYLIVQGDTTSALIASLVGFYYRTKIVHVEAGLRTYNKNSPFPEEANRQMISAVADFHFAPTEEAYGNLIKENKKNIFLTGNTVIDSIYLFKDKVEENHKHYDSKFNDLKQKKICLITIHRRENFGDNLKNICGAIKILAEKFNEIQFLFPVHFNPNVRNIVYDILDGLHNIKLKEPLEYDELLYILSKSYIVLTDSGGIQEEAPTFNLPVIVLRDNTERPEGIKAGCAVLGGTKKDEIINIFSDIIDNKKQYEKMQHTKNPYGDGKAAKRIVNILLNQDHFQKT